MDRFKELNTGAKLVLGATVLFLIVSFFNWYEADLGGLDDVVGVDAGVSMWNGVGVIAGLVAIVLLVWQAIRLANIDFEVGVTPSMITAALAALLLLFTVIRVLDGYEFADRTIWLWIGLLLAVVIAVGAWMNMQASGESFADIRASVAGAASAARGAGDRDDASTTAATEATVPTTPEAPAEPAPAVEPGAPAAPEAPAEPDVSGDEPKAS